MILRGKLYIGDHRDAEDFQGQAIVSLGSSVDSYRTRPGITYLRIVIDDADDEERRQSQSAVANRHVALSSIALMTKRSDRTRPWQALMSTMNVTASWYTLIRS